MLTLEASGELSDYADTSGLVQALAVILEIDASYIRCAAP